MGVLKSFFGEGKQSGEQAVGAFVGSLVIGSVEKIVSIIRRYSKWKEGVRI